MTTRLFNYNEPEIKNLIETRQVKISIFGLGYIGLPLAISMAKQSFKVIGYDIDLSLIETLKQGRSPRVYEENLVNYLADVLKSSKFIPTNNINVAMDSDIIFITVGTPASETQIDLSALLDVIEKIGKHLISGQIVVLRSTVAPGTTIEIVKPLLEEKSNLVEGTEFGLAFVPERTVEGEAFQELSSLHKIIGACSQKTNFILNVLFQGFSPIFNVSSPTEAELAKLYDNLYRDAIIALGSIFGVVAKSKNADIVQAISAANTSPRTNGLVSGCGVGGSCLTKDPYILHHTAKKIGIPTDMILGARNINSYMPNHFVTEIEEFCKSQGFDIIDLNVLILGLTYKVKTNDTRFSVGKTIGMNLLNKGAKIFVFDPLIDQARVQTEFSDFAHYDIYKNPVNPIIDAVILVNPDTTFRGIDFTQFKRHDKIFVFDGRSFLDPEQMLKNSDILYYRI